jgi:hypothetical protein
MDVQQRASASAPRKPRARNRPTPEALTQRLANLRQTVKFLRADDAFHCRMQIMRLEQLLAEMTKGPATG